MALRPISLHAAPAAPPAKSLIKSPPAAKCSRQARSSYQVHPTRSATRNPQALTEKAILKAGNGQWGDDSVVP